MFDKYNALIQRAFIASITFRSEVFLWLFLDTFPIIILIFVWISVYQGHSIINGYSLEKIISYYFLASVIDGITSSHFESWRVREIREGKIDFYLTRPLSYLKELLLRDIGGKIFYLTFSLPFFFLFFIILSGFANLNPPIIGIYQLVNFLIFVILAYITQFLLAAIIVLLGFWFEYAEGLEHFKWLLTAIFTGWMIPIALMPHWLAKIIQMLPLKYLFAVPIGVILNSVNVSIDDYLYFSSFIIGLFIILIWIWNKAKYKYISSGG